MVNILTCGVFDLFHVGHIDFLKRIKNDGDKLYILLHSDRFVSTYKRIPIINENDRFEILKNNKIVDCVFIDDSDYLKKETIDKYKIDKVFQGVINHDIWAYYYHIPKELNIMFFVDYSSQMTSTTNIIKKIKSNYEDDYSKRYSKDNILKSEKIYGYGFQSPGLELDCIIPEKIYKNVLEIGCGLGGNCNYFKKYKGVNITGIDICKNMIEICNERYEDINFILSDYKDYKGTKYDMIFSRDVFMYHNTEITYNNLLKVNSELEDDGVFILIDYCKGEKKDKTFEDYCIRRKWNIIDIPFYKKLIKDTGFKIINENNISDKYIKYFNDKIILDEDVKSNLEYKIDFLNKGVFIWYYFVLTKK